MSMPAEIDRLVQKTSDDDSTKRRQIIEGAQRVFLAQGFDAASMGEIARAAGVSKGTLYVYFGNKEQLFQTIVAEQCKAQAEAIFAFDPNDRDIEGALTRLGTEYVEFLVQPDRVSPVRTVIGITERMPEIGRQFYETGPACGIARLAAYLRAQVDAGLLTIDDCEIAAAQFMDACQSTLFKPILFSFGPPPPPERIGYVVGVAVRVFLAAYRAR